MKIKKLQLIIIKKYFSLIVLLKISIGNVPKYNVYNYCIVNNESIIITDDLTTVI